MTTQALAAIAEAPAPSLITRLAGRFGVEPNKMMTTLKATAFKGDVSNEQMMALLIVAEQYGLNPWTKEVYAFPDKNGIVPVVGVDGWARIINEHPEFDGMEFTDGPVTKEGLPEWIECVIYRRDRAHPIRVREYMAECKRGTGPWGSHPRRMLRHKAMIQCARLAMSFVGIYDQDEAERLVESGERTVEGTAELTSAAPAIAAINAAVLPSGTAAMSYAEVADRIEQANDSDAFNLAVDGIRFVKDLTQRTELMGLAAKKREALEAAARG